LLLPDGSRYLPLPSRRHQGGDGSVTPRAPAFAAVEALAIDMRTGYGVRDWLP